jgi:hypothetical protein
MAVQYKRQIIEVEKRLGFMYVPAQGQEYMPKENTKFNVLLKGEAKPKLLSYNADHKRLFGLTAWYKANKIDAGSVLNIELDTRLMKVNVASSEVPIVIDDEDDEDEKGYSGVDISGLSSTAKGNIIEDRIKELIILYGQGILNVYKPVIDNGGIDLIVLKNGVFQPIYIQVKSRFNVNEKEQMVLTVSGNTFKPHHSFYVLGVSFNPQSLEVDDKLLFMPSHDVDELGIRIKHKNKENIRVVASYKDQSKSQWSKYLIRKSELVDKLLEKFYEIEKYIK